MSFTHLQTFVEDLDFYILLPELSGDPRLVGQQLVPVLEWFRPGSRVKVGLLHEQPAWFGFDHDELRWVASLERRGEGQDFALRVAPMHLANENAWELGYLLFAAELGRVARARTIDRCLLHDLRFGMRSGIEG